MRAARRLDARRRHGLKAQGPAPAAGGVRAVAGANGGPDSRSRPWSTCGRVVSRVEARPVLEHRTWRGAATASRGYESAYYEEPTMALQVFSPAAYARRPVDMIPPDEALAADVAWLDDCLVAATPTRDDRLRPPLRRRSPVRPRLCGAVACAALCVSLPAQAVVLRWDASPGAAGYRLHYGQASAAYTQTLEVGPAIQAAVGSLT